MVPKEFPDEDGEGSVKDSSEEENDWWRDAAAITEQEEDAMRKGFAEAVNNMAEWTKAHTAKVHHSGRVANQSVLSRLIAFKTEDGGFSWTQKRKAVAWRMYNEPNQTPETICEALGCLVNDVLIFFASRMPLVV
jgi:hypothetical protein